MRFTVLIRCVCGSVCARVLAHAYMQGYARALGWHTGLSTGFFVLSWVHVCSDYGSVYVSLCWCQNQSVHVCV